MQIDGNLQRLLRAPHARHVIDVRMRQQNALHAQRLSLDDVEQHVDFVARIDDDRLARRLAGDDVAVLLERRDRPCLDDH